MPCEVLAEGNLWQVSRLMAWRPTRLDAFSRLKLVATLFCPYLKYSKQAARGTNAQHPSNRLVALAPSAAMPAVTLSQTHSELRATAQVKLFAGFQLAYTVQMGASLKTAYLFSYNVLQFVGWLAVLVQLFPLIKGQTLDGAYAVAGRTVGESLSVASLSRLQTACSPRHFRIKTCSDAALIR